MRYPGARIKNGRELSIRWRPYGIRIAVKKWFGGAAEGDSPPIMMRDEVLILEFQRGSRAAFEELNARYCGSFVPFLSSSA